MKKLQACIGRSDAGLDRPGKIRLHVVTHLLNDLVLQTLVSVAGNLRYAGFVRHIESMSVLRVRFWPCTGF